MKTKEQLIDELIDLAFAEDIGDGDHTTLCCIPDTAMGKSRLLIKEPGILAGVEIARKIFHRFDPDLKMTVYIEDGTAVKPGDVAFVVEGRVQSLLQTERLMLNVMQRMSGIATMTHRYVKKLEGLHTRILDTRKTTPGMRILEKMAVKIGGGVNHRIGLFDMILLKDNHVDFAGGIHNAVSRAKEYCKAKGKSLKIELEVRNFDDWYDAVKVLKKAGLSSKEVALFGCGDSESYCDTFCDGIGVLYEELKGTGCKFIGNHVPTGDYNFSSSTAVVDGEFAGLPLDEMNESDKTEGRIDNWVKSLKD